jgi:hypothetical protein
MWSPKDGLDAAQPSEMPFPLPDRESIFLCTRKINEPNYSAAMRDTFDPDWDFAQIGQGDRMQETMLKSRRR